MQIKVNMESNSSYSLFNVDSERAELILNLMSVICNRAYTDFEANYSIHKVDKNGEITYQLAIGKIITEMVSIAETEDEKNYILYCAHTGIKRVSNALQEELEETD